MRKLLSALMERTTDYAQLVDRNLGRMPVDYGWERFWCPRDEHYLATDMGYLSDPNSKHAKTVAPNVKPLHQFQSLSCIVLLGEPGTGKTTEFNKEFERQSQQCHENNEKCIKFNLNEYQTDALLVSDIFDGVEINAWKNGSGDLYLFLDSLDEARIQIKTVANLLSARLSRLQVYASRLKLRIACRSAEWPTSLESLLIKLWPNGESVFLELTPLQLSDVTVAAQRENLDATRFTEEVSMLDAHSFANRPISLKFLMSAFKNNNSLPRTKKDLYETGCLTLCDEFNQSRRDNPDSRQLSPAARYAVATRIASYVEFCGKATITLAHSIDQTAGEISLAQLAGGYEMIQGKQFAVTEAIVREVLETSLFTGRGPQRLAFAHKTYSEFLAAQYLNNKEIDDTQIRSLIFHPNNQRSIVPQLAEIGAWLAIDKPAIFEQIFAGDPLVLLRSDVPTDDQLRFRLVGRLIEGFRTGELDDSNWSMRSHYRKLKHSNIAFQLCPIVTNQNEALVTRRFVADFAEESNATELVSAFLCVTLDQSEDVKVRVQAAYAVSRIGDLSNIKSLEPLLHLSRVDDPEDELLGIALSSLWSRDLLSGKSVFNFLRPPQRSAFLGAYRHFLHFELPKNLSKIDLVHGLRWCTAKPRENRELDVFMDIEKGIVSLALNNLQDDAVLSAFSGFCVSRLLRHDTIPLETRSFQSLDIIVRRNLIRSIISQIDDIDSCFLEPLGLIQEVDLVWILAETRANAIQSERSKYSKLIRRRFSFGGQHLLDLIVTECQINNVLWEEFKFLLEPIPLNSEMADNQRKSYHKNLQLELEIQELEAKRLVKPPPEIRVETCLKRFEEGDLNSWWHLLMEMQLEKDGLNRRCALEGDITKFPGWNVASANTRNRMISAAKQYLLRWKSSPWKIKPRSIFYPDMAGYLAFELLQNYCPEFIESLDDVSWANIAPAIISFPSSTGFGSDSVKRQMSAASLAYSKAAKQTFKTLTKLIDHEDAEEKNGLFILRLVEDCIDEKLGLFLLEKARDRKLRPSSVADLISMAFSVCPEQAENQSRGRLLGSLAQLRSATLCLPRKPRLKSERKTKRLRSRTISFPNWQKRPTNRRKQLLDLTLRLIGVIWENGPHRWQILWPLWKRNTVLFKRSIEYIASERRQSPVVPINLSVSALEELFILLEEHYPHESDPHHDGAYCYGVRDSVKDFRDSVLRAIVANGTQDSIAAIKRLESFFPNLPYLSWVRRDAQLRMLEATWRPLSVEQLRELLAKSGSRVIRTEGDLAAVLIESLNRLLLRLRGETPSIRDIWDYDAKAKTWAPVDENAFSDYVKRHLEMELSSLGVIAMREVEIRRGYSKPGERTDIYVAVAVHAGCSDESDIVRVIVEVKGCWHRELTKALTEQLRDRYLIESQCATGIYLVGWFLCESWRNDDYRQSDTPNWDLQEARDYFMNQAKQASVNGLTIHSVVLDTRI
jgi:hypothetical protein